MLDGLLPVYVIACVIVFIVFCELLDWLRR
jgi:hypothetical protein